MPLALAATWALRSDSTSRRLRSREAHARLVAGGAARPGDSSSAVMPARRRRPLDEEERVETAPSSARSSSRRASSPASSRPHRRSRAARRSRRRAARAAVVVLEDGRDHDVGEVRPPAAGLFLTRRPRAACPELGHLAPDRVGHRAGWTGTCGALATRPPSGPKRAHEVEALMMLTELAVRWSMRPIWSAIDMKRLEKIESCTGSARRRHRRAFTAAPAAPPSFRRPARGRARCGGRPPVTWQVASGSTARRGAHHDRRPRMACPARRSPGCTGTASSHPPQVDRHVSAAGGGATLARPCADRRRATTTGSPTTRTRASSMTAAPPRRSRTHGEGRRHRP